MPARTRRKLMTLAAAIAVPIAIAAFSRTDAAQAGPGFSLSPQNQTVALSTGTLDVQVAVQSPQNVGSFQFVLRYDPGVLTPHSAVAAEFLGSTGRQVQCPEPIIDGNGPGTLKFGCATIGTQGAASASGTTVLAVVTFDLAGGAETAIHIEKDTISTTEGNPLCVANPNAAPAPDDYLNTCPAQAGSVTVTGGDPAKQQGVSATSTPLAIDTSPTAISTGVPSSPAVADGSGTAVTGTSSGATGSGPTGTTAGASSGPAGSAGSGSLAGTGVGKFGYGPQPADHSREHEARVAAFAAALMGLGLLAASRRVRGRI